MGSQFANANGLSQAVLTPENGKSFDYGFVYDPNWLSGLSVNADYFRITLDNLIVSGAGTAQTILTQCFNTQGPICSNVVRAVDGSVKFVTESSFNSGNLTDDGFDIGAHYRLPHTDWGNFALGFDATYIEEYNIASGWLHPASGRAITTRRSATSRRWRALATLDWNMGPFSRELDDALHPFDHGRLRKFRPESVGRGGEHGCRTTRTRLVRCCTSRR